MNGFKDERREEEKQPSFLNVTPACMCPHQGALSTCWLPSLLSNNKLH